MTKCCDWQAKGLLKSGKVVRRLRDAYNRCTDSASSHMTSTTRHGDSVTMMTCASQLMTDLFLLLR